MGRLEITSERDEEREDGLMDLRLRKVMVHPLVGGGGVNLKGDGQVVREVSAKVGAGQMAGGDAGGTDQIECVAFVMGGKIDVLGDV